MENHLLIEEAYLFDLLSLVRWCRVLRLTINIGQLYPGPLIDYRLLLSKAKLDLGQRDLTGVGMGRQQIRLRSVGYPRLVKLPIIIVVIVIKQVVHIRGLLEVCLVVLLSLGLIQESGTIRVQKVVSGCLQLLFFILCGHQGFSRGI